MYKETAMVRHIILWKIDETSGNVESIKKNAKENLEALNGKIEGLKSLRVLTERLGSSSADMMLDSEFDSREALEAYQTHPLHVTAADSYVRPFAKVRLSFDFEA